MSLTDAEIVLKQKVSNYIDKNTDISNNFIREEIFKNVFSYRFPNDIVAIECKNADVSYNYKVGEKIKKGNIIAIINCNELTYDRTSKIIEIDHDYNFDYNFLIQLL